jgi:hypothetical protein
MLLYPAGRSKTLADPANRPTMSYANLYLFWGTQMLDLNFVRENLDAVRTAMANRNFPAGPLDRFVEMDVERRRIISESDAINQQRNAASKEIGDLMKSGDREGAEAEKG